MQESYTPEQASKLALEWCNKNKGWKRICDIADSDRLYKTWEEISAKERNKWISAYGEYSAEAAWKEFGRAPCKVPFGYISGKGEFYDDILKVPQWHNLMMVFKVGNFAEVWK